ncbi:MAG TPA: surface-adhesin E family protein [Pseudomonadales bacterium]
MKSLLSKIILAAAALAASIGTTQATEWEAIESAADVTVYIDPASIRQRDHRAEMWALIDYKNPQMDKTGKQVLSDKLLYQFDCQAKTLAVVGSSAHAGPMASGEIININPDPPQLTPIEAGTLAYSMWKRACGALTAPKK